MRYAIAAYFLEDEPSRRAVAAQRIGDTETKYEHGVINIDCNGFKFYFPARSARHALPSEAPLDRRHLQESMGELGDASYMEDPHRKPRWQPCANYHSQHGQAPSPSQPPIRSGRALVPSPPLQAHKDVCMNVSPSYRFTP